MYILSEYITCVYLVYSFWESTIYIYIRKKLWKHSFILFHTLKHLVCLQYTFLVLHWIKNKESIVYTDSIHLLFIVLQE